MGSGKKNKRGGAPKQKGRLAAALVKDQLASHARNVARQAEERRMERAKELKAIAASGGIKPKKQKQKSEAATAPVTKNTEKELVVIDAKMLEEAEAEREKEEEEEEGAGQQGKKKREMPESVRRKREEMGKSVGKGEVPYGKGETVLLVGEGNFSFAHSLLLTSSVTPSLLLATSYDSFEAASSKYPDLDEHVSAIKEAGGRVLFGVDATKLESYKEIKEGAPKKEAKRDGGWGGVLKGQIGGSDRGGWDKVGFNFPHVGQSIADQNRNIRANQILILNFLRSVAPLLRIGPSLAPSIGKRTAPSNPSIKLPRKKRTKKATTASDSEEEEELGSDPEDADEDLAFELKPGSVGRGGEKPAGTVLLTLRTHAPYSLWSASSLATRGPMLAPSILPKPLPKVPQPTFVVRRSLEFTLSSYPGYEHVRTSVGAKGTSGGGVGKANQALLLTNKERAAARAKGSEGADGAEEEEEEGEVVVEARKGKKNAMRTYEFEVVAGEKRKGKDEDLYD
ncbi:DUF2431 domain containing protein [Pseudohyphozyma bogoriensis]|nr:DUF2431 domain containing protein [Pseudohyphozyma bogoriensis]